MELMFNEEYVLLAAISDGAGSAKFASKGSRIVVANFIRVVSSHFRAGHTADQIDEDLVSEWIDGTRERLYRAAEQCYAHPREFAATLVAAIVCAGRVVVCHIGDGACVIKRRGAELWEVPSWPAHGEYASSTYFVTDEPEAQVQVISIAAPISAVALFSDGIERLALDFQNTTAFSGFFDPMFAPLVDLRPGRDRQLSAVLRKYLDSSQVIARTDDDKSLLLAHRR
jgi:hypothetical protein